MWAAAAVVVVVAVPLSVVSIVVLFIGGRVAFSEPSSVETLLEISSSLGCVNLDTSGVSVAKTLALFSNWFNDSELVVDFGDFDFDQTSYSTSLITSSEKFLSFENI